MRGIEDNPSPKLAEEIYQYNKTFKMHGVAVVAHEIGHLLGAPEVSRNRYCFTIGVRLGRDQVVIF
jgi:hypothetical protein